MNRQAYWNTKFRDEEDEPGARFGGEPDPAVARVISRLGRVFGLSSAPGAVGKPAKNSVEIPLDDAQLVPQAPGTFHYPPRALDLGSGRGRHLVWLASQGWDATGLDFSEVGLSHTREALREKDLNASLLQSDFSSWNPKPNSYELVLAAFIHQDRPNQLALWKAAGLSIVPGGFFVSVSHHPNNASHGPKDPDRLYHPEEVAAAFGQGFQTVSATRLDNESGRVDAVAVLRKQL